MTFRTAIEQDRRDMADRWRQEHKLPYAPTSNESTTHADGRNTRTAAVPPTMRQGSALRAEGGDGRVVKEGAATIGDLVRKQQVSSNTTNALL